MADIDIVLLDPERFARQGESSIPCSAFPHWYLSTFTVKVCLLQYLQFRKLEPVSRLSPPSFAVFTYGAFLELKCVAPDRRRHYERELSAMVQDTTAK